MKCSQSSLFKGICLNLFLVEIPEKNRESTKKYKGEKGEAG